MARTNDVAQIYKIKERLSELRTASRNKQYCNICFEPGCMLHNNSGTCSRQDAVSTLTWWLDLAILESDDVLVFGDNNEIIVPKFPQGNGQKNKAYKYSHVPILDKMIFVYVDGNEQFLFSTSEGKAIKPFPFNVGTNGIYWGYLFENNFYVLITFLNGEWFTSRQKLWDARDIPITAPIVGFWHIPKGRLSYENFAGALTRT